MKTKPRPAKKKYELHEWRPYFRIFPVKILLGTDFTPKDYHPAYQWVYWQRLEMRYQTDEEYYKEAGIIRRKLFRLIKEDPDDTDADNHEASTTK